MTPVDLEPFIRPVPDFPVEGVLFREISPLLASTEALAASARMMAEPFRSPVRPIDVVAGIEARGFIFGSLVAAELGVGFVPVRKAGKLPPETIGHSYDLEYGSDSIEVAVGAVGEGARVLLVDDVLATGGTAAAAISLIEKAGAGSIDLSFLIELDALAGRSALGDGVTTGERLVEAVLSFS